MQQSGLKCKLLERRLLEKRALLSQKLQPLTFVASSIGVHIIKARALAGILHNKDDSYPSLPRFT